MQEKKKSIQIYLVKYLADFLARGLFMLLYYSIILFMILFQFSLLLCQNIYLQMNCFCPDLYIETQKLRN